MATLTATVDELSTQLSRLGVDSELPHVNGADILYRPLDIFRAHLAGLLVAALDCDVQVAYGSIAESAQSDLEVKVPKLRLANANENLARDICLKVRWLLDWSDACWLRN